MKNQLLDMVTFDEWKQLRETSTTTADVAGFQRIAIPLVRRLFPPQITFETKKKKKEPRWQPQVKESNS